MRTHYCGAVTAADIGNSVTLCGWAHRRRDHGGVIFIDLRDREGMMQVVIDPDTPEAFKLAEEVRSEFVLKIDGLVRPRPAGTENPNMPTGMVELLTKKLEVLNPSLTPPFQIDDDNINENIRLQYRYLDLRREPMQKNLKLRYRVSKIMRDYLDAHGFMEVETPMLTRSTPEGARDYLVPSRVHDGMFYALPQSPQLFKQLLMVAGVDRYFQITRCFRDEDLRADRQPEFTQVDLETSFMGEEAIMNLVEGMIRDMMKSAQDIDLPAAFQRMSYAEAMHRYGSDKPDMRVTLEIVDVGDVMKRRRIQGLLRPGQRSERPCRRAAHPRRRCTFAQRNRRLYRIRQNLRRQGPGLHQGQRCRRNSTNPACNRPSSRTSPKPRSPQ